MENIRILTIWWQQKSNSMKYAIVLQIIFFCLFKNVIILGQCSSCVNASTVKVYDEVIRSGYEFSHESCYCLGYGNKINEIGHFIENTTLVSLPVSWYNGKDVLIEGVIPSGKFVKKETKGYSALKTKSIISFGMNMDEYTEEDVPTFVKDPSLKDLLPIPDTTTYLILPSYDFDEMLRFLKYNQKHQFEDEVWQDSLDSFILNDGDTVTTITYPRLETKITGYFETEDTVFFVDLAIESYAEKDITDTLFQLRYQIFANNSGDFHFFSENQFFPNSENILYIKWVLLKEKSFQDYLSQLDGGLIIRRNSDREKDPDIILESKNIGAVSNLALEIYYNDIKLVTYSTAAYIPR